MPASVILRMSFLALAMQKYLDDLSCEAGVAPEWKELLRDLDRLQRCASSIAAPIGWCAPTRRGRSLLCSAKPMSRCRREPDKPRPAEARGLHKIRPKTPRPPQA